MLKRLMTVCAVAGTMAFTAGSAFAANNVSTTVADVAKFKEAPAQYMAAFKDDALTEAVYQLAMADVDAVPAIVALLDTMSEGDKRLVAAGLGRAARAFTEAKNIDSAVKIQQAIARQSDAVRMAFNVGAGQKLLGTSTSSSDTSGGGGSTQTSSALSSGSNSSTDSDSTTASSSSGGSLGTGGSSGSSGSSGNGGFASGSAGSGGVVVNVVTSNTNSSCSGTCTSVVSP